MVAPLDARARLVNHEGLARGELARAAYTYAHVPLVAGIVVTAVADELVLAHPMGHTEPATATVILGGAALFLAGSALFNRMMCGAWPGSHVAGLAGVGALIVAVPAAPPVALSAATTIVLASVGAWESWTRTPAAGPDGPATSTSVRRPTS